MSKRPTLTRRGLFRSVAATSAATAVLGCKPGETTAPAATTAGERGPDPAPIRFTLNGEAVEASAAPSTTALSMLRNILDRTGAKEVCDRGACGACMIDVDGVLRNSCMMLAPDLEGRAVTTVEARAGDATLDRLQRAFVEHDAMQCGFCTSGMVMSARSLLQRSGGQPLTRKEVQAGLAGNLCRCGTYPHVIDAVISVSKLARTGGNKDA